MISSDFKKRKAATAEPKPKPASTGNAHDYTACDDDDCPRFPCKVYKEGLADGHGAGYASGQAAGYAEGYSDGYGAGESAE